MGFTRLTLPILIEICLVRCVGRSLLLGGELSCRGRTVSILCSDGGWEIREFQLCDTIGILDHDTIGFDSFDGTGVVLPIKHREIFSV